MDNKGVALLGPLKLFEVSCIVSFLTTEDKMLKLALLSKNWHSNVHSPFFWNQLPSDLIKEASYDSVFFYLNSSILMESAFISYQ